MMHLGYGHMFRPEEYKNSMQCPDWAGIARKSFLSATLRAEGADFDDGLISPRNCGRVKVIERVLENDRRA